MLSRIRVKICGITRPEDALASISLGADAIGLVFYEQSPRSVSIAQAREICSVMPPFVTVVGLFVDRPLHEIEAICAQVPLSLLQFHGEELEADCAKIGTPYIKAVRVKETQDVLDAQAAYPSAQGLLLDTYRSGVPGGTGETFDWGLVPSGLTKPIILAGGLEAENVRKAIEVVNPYAVDVSGGVEAAKGIKDPLKIKSFISEVSRG